MKSMWVAIYATLALFHLMLIVAGANELVSATKPLLMPVLLVCFIMVTPKLKTPIAIATMIALVFSWAGDVLLQAPGELGFLIGLGAFLLAQISYIVAFLQTKRARIRITSAFFVIWFAALVATLAPSLGSLLIPVIAYGFVLATMATLSSSLGWVIALGGILFFASDSMLALNRFLPGFDLPASDFLIMSTYVAAEGLLAFGLSNKILVHSKKEPA